MANKNTHVYVAKAGVYDWGTKNMEERGVVVESVNYPPLAKGTKVHGHENYCAIEQNGVYLGRREKDKWASWVTDIEKLAPRIKASFFGLGSYKNVTITAVNSLGAQVRVPVSAKSANGVSCSFNSLVKVYLGPIDLKKFKGWMAEWGHKFGLRKKGNVWISKAEFQVFLSKAVVPYCVETAIKSMHAPAGTSFAMNGSNARSTYDTIAKMIQGYLTNNLGLSASVYFD